MRTVKATPYREVLSYYYLAKTDKQANAMACFLASRR
jgi:hypothetical protein